MECKKCAKEVVEGATFCPYCGARADGKIVCKACGTLNQDDYSYCIKCGARIDGKTVCANCGSAYEGNFCPSCGQAGEPVKRAEKKASTNGGLLSKVLGIVSGGCMMLGVLFSLIFSFFISIKGKAGAIVTAEVQNIFHFFGDYYKELDEVEAATTGMTKWFQDTIKGQATLVGIVGTVLCAAILICVLTFATIAIVKYVRGWVTKKENNSHAWALGTVLTYFGGVASYFAFNRILLDYSGTEIQTALSGGTTAGVVLCAIVATAGLVLRVVSQGKALWAKKNLSKVVCSIVGVALAGVLLALMQGASIVFELVEGTEVMTVNMGVGYFTLMAAVASGSSWGADSDRVGEFLKYEQATRDISVVLVFGLIALIVLIAMVVFAVLAIRAQASGVTGGKRSGLAWAICLVACSVTYLVFNIIVVEKFFDALILAIEASTTATGTQSFSYTVNYAIAICCIVFSILLLATSIVRTVFARKSENE